MPRHHCPHDASMQHAGATIVVVGQRRAAAALTLIVHPLDNAQVGHVVLLKLRQLAHELRVGLGELQPSAQRSSRPRRPTDTLALKVGGLLLQLGKFLLAAHDAWSGLAAAASARRCVPACSLVAEARPFASVSPRSVPCLPPRFTGSPGSPDFLAIEPISICTVPFACYRVRTESAKTRSLSPPREREFWRDWALGRA